MAPIGTCWATGTWIEDTWATGSWAMYIIAVIHKSRFFRRYVQPHGREDKQRG